MSRFTEIMKKIASNMNKDKEPSGPPTTIQDDYESKDKYLKGLRRQHRRIMDEQEKNVLQKRIGEHFKKKNSEILIGSGILGKPKKQIQKKTSFLSKTNMIKKGRI